MTIDLSPKEIEFISESLAAYKSHVDSYGEEDKSREYKALRMKVDSALLKLSMDGEL